MKELPTFGITHPFITSATGLDVAHGMALELVTEIVSDLADDEGKDGANITIPVLILYASPEDILQAYAMQPHILAAANSAVTAYDCTIMSLIPYVTHGIRDAAEEGILTQNIYGANVAVGWRLQVVKNTTLAEIANEVDEDGDPKAAMLWRQLMDESLAKAMKDILSHEEG